ncbi:hypothetical protein AB1E18_005168 [Capra hircus]
MITAEKNLKGRGASPGHLLAQVLWKLSTTTTTTTPQKPGMLTGEPNNAEEREPEEPTRGAGDHLEAGPQRRGRASGAKTGRAAAPAHSGHRACKRGPGRAAGHLADGWQREQQQRPPPPPRGSSADPPAAAAAAAAALGLLPPHSACSRRGPDPSPGGARSPRPRGPAAWSPARRGKAARVTATAGRRWRRPWRRRRQPPPLTRR